MKSIFGFEKLSFGLNRIRVSDLHTKIYTLNYWVWARAFQGYSKS